MTIESRSGVHATVRYVPDEGYRGTDSFTFRVTDSRGLTSTPGTVQVTTTAPKQHTAITASVSRHVGTRYTYIYVHGKITPSNGQMLTLHYKGVHAARWIDDAHQADCGRRLGAGHHPHVAPHAPLVDDRRDRARLADHDPCADRRLPAPLDVRRIDQRVLDGQPHPADRGPLIRRAVSRLPTL